MRHKNKPQIEEDIFITTPGPVPKEPEHYVNRCYCEQCLAYRGTYEKDDDTDFPGTPEYVQESKGK